MAHAIEAQLARIIAAERERGAERYARIRLGAAVVLAAFATVFGVILRAHGWTGTAPVIFTYLGFALGLWLIARAHLFSAKTLMLSIALIDVPAVTLGELAAMTTSEPRFLFGPSLGMYCALIAGSTLTLSRTVVIATTISVLVGQAFLYASVGAPLAQHATIIISPIGIAAIAIYLVGRIQFLVIESRKDDLVGKYVLGERIGAGGMAEVFRATYSPEGGFERAVAVKRVLPAYAADSAFIARFRREAELTAQLVHPNIVQVLDFGTFRETYFLAMELVDGVSLSKITDEVPLSAAAYVGLQLSAALDFVHNRLGPDGQPLKLVHRDVNPPNVLVSKHGEVKLADFGVARAMTGPQLTATGAVVGKVTYLAPEQLSGAQYDGQADMFALGLTLYELVASRPAIDTTSEVSAMKALLEAKFVAPSQVRKDVPAPLDEIVLRLLERDPRARMNAAELHVRLLALTGPAADFNEGRRWLAAAVERAKGAVPTSQEVPTLPHANAQAETRAS